MPIGRCSFAAISWCELWQVHCNSTWHPLDKRRDCLDFCPVCSRVFYLCQYINIYFLSRAWPWRWQRTKRKNSLCLSSITMKFWLYENSLWSNPKHRPLLRPRPQLRNVSIPVNFLPKINLPFWVAEEESWWVWESKNINTHLGGGSLWSRVMHERMKCVWQGRGVNLTRSRKFVVLRQRIKGCLSLKIAD